MSKPTTTSLFTRTLDISVLAAIFSWLAIVSIFIDHLLRGGTPNVISYFLIIAFMTGTLLAALYLSVYLWLFFWIRFRSSKQVKKLIESSLSKNSPINKLAKKAFQSFQATEESGD